MTGRGSRCSRCKELVASSTMGWAVHLWKANQSQCLTGGTDVRPFFILMIGTQHWFIHQCTRRILRLTLCTAALKVKPFCDTRKSKANWLVTIGLIYHLSAKTSSLDICVSQARSSTTACNAQSQSQYDA